VLSEPPIAADAAVALGGDGLGGRARRAAELVRDGYAPKAYLIDERVCTRGYCVRWSELWRSGRPSATVDLSQIVPREAIEPLLDDVDRLPGTFEEAEAAWSRLRLRSVRRILLVTDEFHSRRAAMVWRHVTAGQAEVISVPCTTLCLGMQRWWQDREAVKAVWLELLRLSAYAAMGRL
jgi:uncharacterized SAM-binding protein YcdF (DUF218 family)